MDVTRNSYTLLNLFCPSKGNNVGTGFDEKYVDLSGISKSLITSLGFARFLGNSNLESADMSGFGDIDASTVCLHTARISNASTSIR